MSDTGGVPADMGVGVAGWPNFLPDGRHYLALGAVVAGSEIPLLLRTLDSEESRKMMKVDSRAEYAAGHIFYTSQGTLMARPFSEETLTVTGDPFPVTDRMQQQGLGRVDFSLSRAGDLAFMAQAQQPLSQLVWVDRAGRDAGSLGEAALYREIALSPDETRLAVAIEGGPDLSYDIWVFDLRRGLRSRFTFGAMFEAFPAWSRDGQWIAYGSGNRPVVVRKLASGAGGEQPVFASGDGKIAVPADWSPDGRTILVEEVDSSRENSDLLAVPANQAGPAVPFIQTPPRLVESSARFSPDGRWVADQLNESDQTEVYVQAYPATGGKWQVSTAGGQWPRWRGDGREIVYTTTDDIMFAVPIATDGGEVRAGTPERLFQRRKNRVGIGARSRWEMTRDGQRFLLNVPADDPDAATATVILDWAAGTTARAK